MNARDKEGRTSLVAALAYGKLDCLNALIAAGADTNARDKDGRTQLVAAVAYGKLDCLNALPRMLP